MENFRNTTDFIPTTFPNIDNVRGLAESKPPLQMKRSKKIELIKECSKMTFS